MLRGSYILVYSLAIIVILSPPLQAYLLQPQPSSGEKVAVTTTTILWDMVRNVAGPAWRVESLVAPGMDPHSFEPTPRDAVKLSRASVVFYNGFGVDRWLLKMAESSRGARLVRVTDGLEQYILLVPDGPYAGKPDPHMWMDVQLAIKYVEKIRDAFVELDPANADEYVARAAEYIDRLWELDAWIRETVSSIPLEKRLLFTQENAFQYFAKRYGFGVAGYFYSIITELEPSPLELSRAYERVKGTGLCVYFIESTLSPRAMQAFAARAGGRIAGRLYTDSIGPPGSGLDSYLAMMKYNTETIVKELSGEC
jgi:ABC-type Zn uptake system ZnuABC Zn-binding protein ZnuA